MKTISIIIPLFNEARGVEELLSRLNKTANALDFSFEFVIVDDGSDDDTLERLRVYNLGRHRKVLIKLSRNWGQQNAYNAGLDHATGDIAIFMDGDLEDPPELLPDLIAKWEDGYDIVCAVKRSRNGSAIRSLCFIVFYWLLNKISTVKVPSQAGMFFLADGKVLQALRRCKEFNKYYPGLRAYSGFRQAEVLYDRQERYDGTPRQSFRRLTSLGLNAFFSFSFLPIRLLTYFGIGLIFLTILASVILSAIKIFDLQPFGVTVIGGWTSIMLCLLFVMSVQIIFLGIIGEYIARIYDEVRDRPYYFVSEVITDVGESCFDRAGEGKLT